MSGSWRRVGGKEVLLILPELLGWRGVRWGRTEQGSKIPKAFTPFLANEDKQPACTRAPPVLTEAPTSTLAVKDLG